MAHINVDKRIVANIYNDDIKAELNAIIDTELLKDECDIDVDLVEACIVALDEIEREEGNNILVPLVSSDKYLSAIHSILHLNRLQRISRPVKVAMLVAIIASGTFTANAAVKAITDYDIIGTIAEKIKGATSLDENDLFNNNDKFDDIFSDETTTNNSTTNNIEKTTTDKATTLASTTNPSTVDNRGTTVKEVNGGEESPAEPTSHSAYVAPTSPSDLNNKEDATLDRLLYDTKNMKTDYIYGERLNYNGLTMTAYYSDNTSKKITLSDCDFYTKSVDMNKTADYTLTILYKNATIKINITVRPDEETRGSQICSNSEFSYLKNNKGAYITSYLGSSNSIDASYIDGTPVYAISAKMFKDSSIKSFSSSTVKKIFASAFEGCSDLTYFYAPNAEYVGSAAFKNCNKLSDLTLGNYSYVGESAFRNTGIKELTIPSSISVIPDRLCENCSKLTKVKLDGTVTTVGDYAFSECEDLEYVKGAGNIVSVGKFGFYADENVEFDSFNSKFKSAGEGAFYACRNIEMGELNHLESVGAGAFERCTGLTGVTIPSSMTSIPSNAFKTTNIKSLVIPSTVRTIGDYAFMSTKITELTLPSSVTSVGTYAFYTITLRDIYLPSTLNIIGFNAFYNGSRVKIYAPSGSYAEKYAKDNDFTLAENK